MADIRINQFERWLHLEFKLSERQVFYVL